MAPPDSGSLIIGGGIGYNWSVGDFVAGVEADYSAENIRTGTWTPASVPFHAASEALATARVRAGVVVTQIPYLPWALVYATGGAAFSDISTTYCLPSPSCFASGPGPGRATETAFKGGWTAGGGIEFPVAPNVTTKIEALYADFGAASFQYAGAVYTIRSTEELVRAGINFRFAGN